MDKHQQRIELLKKFLETRAAFKKKVQEARRGQAQVEEETTKFFKPVTEAVLGKQPEIPSLSPEELAKIKEKGLLGLIGEKLKEENKRIAEELVRDIADPIVRQAEFDRLINNPLALQHAITRMTVNPDEIKRLVEKVSEKAEGLTEQQKMLQQSMIKMMPLGESINTQRKKARVEIDEPEYDNFIEKHGITDIDNIRYWSEEKNNDLMKQLTEIIEDGSRADEEIKGQKDEEKFSALVDRIREGIIADIFRKTAKRYRNKPGGYKQWDFKKLLKHNESKRDKRLPEKEETTGSGIKIFTSNAKIVDRLMLLISSKEAGNESAEIDNEIVDILDHLRSSGLLTSSEYKILHSDLI